MFLNVFVLKENIIPSIMCVIRNPRQINFGTFAHLRKPLMNITSFQIKITHKRTSPNEIVLLASKGR